MVQPRIAKLYRHDHCGHDRDQPWHEQPGQRTDHRARGSGVEVASAEPGGPAAKAGIQAGEGKIEFQGQKDIPQGGDTIVAVDGKPIVQSSDLPNAISLKGPGDKVRLTILRGKQRRTVTVTLAPRPNKPAPTSP